MARGESGGRAWPVGDSRGLTGHLPRGAPGEEKAQQGESECGVAAAQTPGSGK